MGFSSKLSRIIAPESAHRMALWGLNIGVLQPRKMVNYPILQHAVWGIVFDNPIGMAAGFDKNAECISGLQRCGFGFVETGTVTPRPQPGNPQPRIFRLPEDRALINRLGFNNAGVEAFMRNIERHRPGIVGINIGKNKDTVEAVEDYQILLRRVYSHCDYITVNISSPNTPGLRDLQRREQLEVLLQTLVAESQILAKDTGRKTPLLVKISPDTTAHERETIAELALTYAIDGLIVSNTTVARPDALENTYRDEQGGLSGRPLRDISYAALKETYRLTRGKLPLIGVGGIENGADAYARIRAGASLIQLYTALIYEGFGLVERLKKELAELLEQDGFENIADAVGVDSGL